MGTAGWRRIRMETKMEMDGDDGRRRRQWWTETMMAMNDDGR